MLLLKPCTGLTLLLRPQDRADYYPPPTTEAASAIVYWRVRRADGTVAAWHEHDEVSPTATTSIHYNPTDDQLLDIAIISQSLSNVPSHPSIEAAIVATAIMQRDTDAPVIAQVGAATADLLTLVASRFSRYAHRRKVRIADNVEMTGAITVVEDVGLERLPEVFYISRNVIEGVHTVIVSGAGTDAVNGTYTMRGMFNGREYYNLAGEPDSTNTNSIVFDGLTAWNILNGARDIVYQDQTGDEFPWLSDWAIGDAGLGDSPAPTVTQDTTPATLSQNIFVRVSHSAGNSFGAESEAQGFAFADSNNTGGSSGNGDPFNGKKINIDDL